MSRSKPIFFPSAADFRRWLENNHATAKELRLGFYKKASGKGGLTYPEAVDELLCFGWIDGVIHRIDEERYTHRITPRRPGSVWSLVNVSHVKRLTMAGKMHPSGLAAFRTHLKSKTRAYSFANRAQVFSPGLARIFRANKTAWACWQAQPPGYQRAVIHWVSSAKQEMTRLRRLAQLITVTANGRRLGGK